MVSDQGDLKMEEIKKYFTIETRINKEENEEFIEYIEAYLPFFAKVFRHTFNLINGKGRIKELGGEAEIRKYLMHKFGISKRTAKSIYSEAKTRYNSLKGLKEYEYGALQSRIAALEEIIKAQEKSLKFYYESLKKAPLSQKRHKKFKNLKKSLYAHKMKLDRLKQKSNKLNETIESGRFSICFGTKKLFKAQHHLKASRFKSHQGWLNQFRKNRDKSIFYCGSYDEAGANQMFAVCKTEVEGVYDFNVVKEYRYRKSNKVADRRVLLKGITFNHLKEIYAGFVYLGSKAKTPLSYRVLKRENKYYLQAIFPLVQDSFKTDSDYGVIGLDFNDGFIALTETDRKGNIVYLTRYDFKARNNGERRDKLFCCVRDITAYAATRGKDLVIENLSFKTKKTKLFKAKTRAGKEYNKRLSSFEYRTYKEAFESRAFKEGVILNKVNPAYTSKIGKEKYASSRSLNVHSSAAYVIARRSQGFKDKLKKKN